MVIRMIPAVVLLLVLLLVFAGCGVARQQYDIVLAERDSALAQCQSVQNELDSVKTQLISTESDLSMAKSQYQSVVGEMESSKSQLESIQEELSAANSKIETLQADLSNITSVATSLSVKTKLAEQILTFENYHYQSIVAEREKRTADKKEIDSKALAALELFDASVKEIADVELSKCWGVSLAAGRTGESRSGPETSLLV